MLRKNDLILIAVILIIAIAGYFIIVVNRQEGATVVITVDGKEYEKVPLSVDNTITIENDEGELNVIQIKDGKVSMIEANCPDKLCVLHNAIHYDHESIICLPHKVVVEIQDGESSEADIIAN